MGTGQHFNLFPYGVISYNWDENYHRQSCSMTRHLSILVKYFLLIPFISFIASVCVLLLYFGLTFSPMMSGRGVFLIFAGSLHLNAMYGTCMLPIFLNLIGAIRRHRVLQAFTFLALPLGWIVFHASKIDYRDHTSDFVLYAATGLVFLLTASAMLKKFRQEMV